MLVSSLIAALHLIFWAGSLTELAAPGFHESGWPMSSRDPLFSTSPMLRFSCVPPCLMRVGNPHSGHRTCVVSFFLRYLLSLTLFCMEDRVSFGHLDWPQPYSPQLLEYRYHKPLPSALITTCNSAHCGSLFQTHLSDRLSIGWQVASLLQSGALVSVTQLEGERLLWNNGLVPCKVSSLVLV